MSGFEVSKIIEEYVICLFDNIWNSDLNSLCLDLTPKSQEQDWKHVEKSWILFPRSWIIMKNIQKQCF